MKSFKAICFSINANNASWAMIERSMGVVFKGEGMDYNYDYGSRTR
jgi:hypothetical protein